jgi:hypothetical protein
MRTLLSPSALLEAGLVGCFDAATSRTGSDSSRPNLACAGQSGSCGGGTHANNSNGPPNTAP